MPFDDDITELTEVHADRVDAVGRPASGLPFLVLKQLADQNVGDVAKADATADDSKKDCSTCDGKGKILEGNRDCPDCDATGKVTKADADLGEADAPSSAGWESADAAALRNIAAQLAGLKTKIEASAEREQIEAMAPGGDPGDYENAWDLSDACNALDYVLGIVAAMSFGEAQESADAADDGAVVVKAGKKISTDTATKLKTARAHMVSGAAHITDLLGDTTDDTTEEVDVTKEQLTTMLAERDETLLTKMAELVKPAGTDSTDVAKGAEPVATTETATDVPTEGEAGKAQGDKPDADTTAPAEGVVKTADLESLLKSTITETIKAAVTPLEERLGTVEKQAKPGGPLLNGAAHMPLRGQAANSPDAVVAKSTEGLSPIQRAEQSNDTGRATLAALFGGNQP